jgi:hypothetical protein
MPHPSEVAAVGRAQVIGALGETLALAHLLARGWLAANANVGGVRSILLAVKGTRYLRAAVKPIGWGEHQAQWSIGVGERERLFKDATRPDIVAFIWLQEPGTILHRAFVVPAGRAERDVMEAYRLWLSRPRGDGSPRRDTGQVGIGFLDRDTEGNVASDFARKWAEFEDAWEVADDAGKAVQ